LHTRRARPFQVLNKTDNNAYVIDLPKDFVIDYIFNVEDLVDFKDHDFNPITH